jgi:hypothetical protein
LVSVRWARNAVVSARLKSGRRVVAQMLEDPYLHFFQWFTDPDEAIEIDLETVPALFCCAVTRQFLRHSDVRKERGVRPHPDLHAPELWIDTYDGWRTRVVWPNTKHERSVLLMGEEPGGRLTADDDTGDIGDEIELDDGETIDRYELTNIWTFPGLNERLHLCDILDKPVGPLKDLSFDRPLPLEAKTFVDIIGSHGGLESWGYAAKAAQRATKKKAAKAKGKKKAAKAKAKKKKKATKRKAR